MNNVYVYSIHLLLTNSSVFTVWQMLSDTADTSQNKAHVLSLSQEFTRYSRLAIWALLLWIKKKKIWHCDQDYMIGKNFLNDHLTQNLKNGYFIRWCPFVVVKTILVLFDLLMNIEHINKLMGNLLWY